MVLNRPKTDNLRLVQHGLIRRAAVPETLIQFFILSGVVGLFEVLDLSFELSLLLLLVVGFSFVTLNIMSATMSQNVHLAEIRDLIIELRSDERNDRTGKS